MIRVSRNQLYNIGNRFQGSTKKVLTVCSAGLLRSATLQNYLIKTYNYNVRTCGTEDYALVPISEALVFWADEIVFVNPQNFNRVENRLRELELLGKCYVLDIPDMYNFNSDELVELCRVQYENKSLYALEELSRNALAIY
jgi:predicted protein tyrosine phosphatase